MQGQKPIKTIGITSNLITGEAGLTCEADLLLEEAREIRFDSLLFPGCMDITTLKDSHEQ
jgi:4-methyl-5(b-hydroxyethyl)-thiazole monophosphate biosynthesis